MISKTKGPFELMKQELCSRSKGELAYITLMALVAVGFYTIMVLSVVGYLDNGEVPRAKHEMSCKPKIVNPNRPKATERINQHTIEI